jgi:Fungal protein kinase
MAIEVLLGEKHSLMHDLESFFCVLFWICVHYNRLGEKGKLWKREDAELYTRMRDILREAQRDTTLLAESQRQLKNVGITAA